MKSRKEEKKRPARKGRWENAISGKQLDSVRKETHVVSFSHDPASGYRRDQGREGQSSSPAPKAKAQTDGKDSLEKVQAAEEIALLEQEERFHAENPKVKVCEAVM